jgi:hypothetical protein
MSTRQCRDSFLKLISDNLVGITVHNLRRDTQDDDSEFLMMNAVNVHYLNTRFGGPSQDSIQQVAIDVVNADDLTALDWAEQVAAILQSAGFTPKLDYSGSTPVPVGTNIYWTGKNIPAVINFRPITTDGSYARYHCLLSLKHIA